MFTFLVLSYLVVSCVGTEVVSNNTTKFPLCTICKCQMKTNTGTEYADIICTNKVSHDVFDPTFWQTTADNKTISYNYHSFNIENNVFTNLSKEFPSSNLVYLNLANNNIVTITTSIFKNLQNMKVLILSYNDLENIDPDAFKGVYMPKRYLPLKNLRELRLDHNKLHTINQNIFEHTAYIEILDLSHNPLKIIDHHTLVAITYLSQLKELYLQYTELKTLPDTMLHTPKNLQVLDLSGNPISRMFKTLGETHNLTNLYLNNTGFVNLTDHNIFPPIPSLKVLHLCRNEYLYYIGKHALGGLSNLMDVRLCDNNVLTEIEPLAFAEPTSEIGGNVWPKITKLHLGNNKLSYLDSAIVGRWDKLAELDIRGNPWVCECENQWLIDVLYPTYLKIDEKRAKEVKCAAPIEMVKFSFQDLYEKKDHMRCLDLNGAHPENDALMLVGILTGLLIALPLITLFIVGYQRKWFNIFGMCDDSPAAYSRRFYRASPTEEI